ncbi:MAG: proline racemase family protein [Bryobacteraceae bacterium]
MQMVHFIDSHTGGEPTRLVVEGGPDLGAGPLTERLERFRSEHDLFRSAVVNEPRGSDAVVGALLCPPADPDCAAGVIFFNNVGYLGMCGHGTIGLVATLAWMGRISAGIQRIETPVGVVTAELHENGEVTLGNVPAYRLLRNAIVDVPGHGDVHGDVAWGGNWFFLTYDHRYPLDLDHLEELTSYAWAIRQALREQGVQGAGGREIDHVELFSKPTPDAPSRSFVLCPGKAYDRSPCGTGTSAKMACLWADGLLEPGQPYRQQSIVGSLFEGYVEERDGQLWPFIRGSAFVTAEGRLILDERDPFRWGIRP